MFKTLERQSLTFRFCHTNTNSGWISPVFEKNKQTMLSFN